VLGDACPRFPFGECFCQQRSPAGRCRATLAKGPGGRRRRRGVPRPGKADQSATGWCR
jgi:hypothetical protein